MFDLSFGLFEDLTSEADVKETVDGACIELWVNKVRACGGERNKQVIEQRAKWK